MLGCSERQIPGPLRGSLVVVVLDPCRRDCGGIWSGRSLVAGEGHSSLYCVAETEQCALSGGARGEEDRIDAGVRDEACFRLIYRTKTKRDVSDLSCYEIRACSQWHRDSKLRVFQELGVIDSEIYL